MTERAEPLTSEELAACFQINPVVIRRTMAGLREAGLVASERGHGGGWRLRREPGRISLRDVYAALGEPMVFQMAPHTESPGCIVEQAVNGAMEDAFEEARALLMSRFETITLAALAADIAKRRKHCSKEG